MTRAAFIDLIRQFKSAAQRKRRSYAQGVNAVLAVYREAVMNSDMSPEAANDEIRWANEAVAREYAPSDASYQPTVEG